MAAAMILVLVAIVIFAILFRVLGLASDEPPAMELPAPIWEEAVIETPEPQSSAETPAPEAEPMADETLAAQEPSSRYAPVTEAEIELMARVVYAEANTESAAGQQAVAEVILNRRAAGNFADTIEAVVFAPGQFSTASILHRVTPTSANYDAVLAALYGEAILPMDVVYFSQGAENSRVWGTIGNHVFCYQYVWG